MGDLLESFANDTIALKEQIAEICYFMKGGIEFNSAWGMSYEDREVAIGVINKRIKEASPGGKEYM